MKQNTSIESKEMSSPFSLYATMAAIHKRKGMTELALLGQEPKAFEDPSFLLGVSFDRSLIKRISQELKISEKEFENLYTGRKTTFEMYDLSDKSYVADNKQGTGGAAILLQISGDLYDGKIITPWFRNRIKYIQFDGDFSIRARKSDEDKFANFCQGGTCKLDGPDYAKSALLSILQGKKPFENDTYSIRNNQRDLELILQNQTFQLVVRKQYLRFM